MDGLFKYIGNRAWFTRALSLWGHLETARLGGRAQEKNEHVMRNHSLCSYKWSRSNYSLYFMGLQTAGLRYSQPLNNCILRLWIFFWDEPFLSRLYENYLSIKDLEILAKFRLSQILHLWTQKSVCATNFGPFGEIGANFPVQLSSRSHFANIENRKIIAKNQCEKHKN